MKSDFLLYFYFEKLPKMPTTILRYSNGRVMVIMHTNDQDQLHCEDGPAFVQFHKNGKRIIEKFCFQGMLHRLNFPAFTIWHPNGKPHIVCYYKFDKLHRVNGPSKTMFDTLGNLTYESYSRCDSNQSSIVYYNSKGAIQTSSKFENDKLHSPESVASARNYDISWYSFNQPVSSIVIEEF